MSRKDKYVNIKRWFAFFLIAFSALAVRLYSISQIKMMTKEEDLLIQRINETRDRIDDYLVKIQKLSSEERIVKIAREKLGLVKPLKPMEKIEINLSLINRIKKIVNEKYE